MENKKKNISVDGNTAAAYIGYALSDVACIYPITPSTPMAELCDEWAAKGQKNIFDNTIEVIEMQSEAGAAGAVHGAASTGGLATTYTASQGLLLMIPNMYKIAGECLPVVFHVSARTLAVQALNIFGDHQDVMACRQTGFCMLASNNVQEAMDLALIAHIAALKSSLPFMHFFDGFRTSHEINKIEEVSYDVIRQLLPFDKIAEFRAKSHNPEHPKLSGTCQNGDTYFQNRELCNILYDKVYNIVETAMNDFGKITGRKYAPFNYVGAPDATDVIVVMCSGSDTVHETLDTVVKQGKKYGMVSVHLYRPFNGAAFVKALPKTVKKITVLDRTKESGSIGEPLYLDVVMALNQNKMSNIEVLSGRYGLGGKEFTPFNVVSVYENMASSKPINKFTVGIEDDVTHLSLPAPKTFKGLVNDYVEFKFWGLGADGTVSANKSSIKIIGQNTNKYVQGYFEYDSKKSGGLTISHLRMSDGVIRSPYFVQTVDFVAIHNFVYVNKYDVLEGLKENGKVLLNTIYSPEEIGKHLPDAFKKILVAKKAKLYIIDAHKVAGAAGLKNRINVIMQSCFFKITNIIDYAKVEKLMKDAAVKAYSKKGDAIVASNMKAIDAATIDLLEVDVNKIAKQPTLDNQAKRKVSEYYRKFCEVIESHRGDSLKVSDFAIDGSVPTGTSQFEKRCIGQNVTTWLAQNCIQCGQCVLVCPHAALRAGLHANAELKNKPANYNTKDALGVKDAQFRIQVSPCDCTGCGSCVKVCPAKEKALALKPINDMIKQEESNFEYFIKANKLPNPFNKKTIKGVQFEKPYFEFSGACAGCGETPYVKLISQLYGKQMVVANATGCSSIYSSSSPTTPYCTDEQGCGPTWANSLFEDNAEFGYGMAIALRYRRKAAYDHLATVLAKDKVQPEMKKAIEQLIAHKEDENCQEFINKVVELAKVHPQVCENNKCECFKKIIANKSLYNKKSVWIFGGDGWAYDIGFGGLDHVFASGENVNVLVMDTEVYSNTGGQSSKSSPQGSIAKFTANGKTTNKKDLGAIAMTYKNVYVAQIAMGADQNQTLKAIAEAEAYPGVSLIIAYSPCINHGFDLSGAQNEMKKAVQSGYWQLYRYNPALANKFVLDSKDPTLSYQEFLDGETRYSQLKKKAPESAAKLFAAAEENAKEKLANLKTLVK